MFRKLIVIIRYNIIHSQSVRNLIAIRCDLTLIDLAKVLNDS